MGGAGDILVSSSRLLEADRTPLAADDANAADFGDDDFILAVHWYNSSDMDATAEETRELQWQNITDGGDWTDLTGAGELTWIATTVLTDGINLDSGNYACDDVGGRNVDDTVGEEHEGSNTIVIQLGGDDETESQIAVDCSGAIAEKQYGFRVQIVEAGATIALDPKITMAAAGAIEVGAADVATAASVGAGALNRIFVLIGANVECLASVSAGVVNLVGPPPPLFIAKDMEFDLTAKSTDFNFTAKTENVKFG